MTLASTAKKVFTSKTFKNGSKFVVTTLVGAYASSVAEKKMDGAFARLEERPTPTPIQTPKNKTA